MKYISTRGDAHASAASPRSCSKAWRRTAACTCRALSAGRRGDARALARPAAIAELAFEILSLYIDDIPAADLRALVAKTYTARGLRHAARSRRCKPLEPGLCARRRCRTARRSRSRTWRCSCSATCSSTSSARRGETLNILGATSGDTGSAAEYAMRGKRGVRVFMLSPARPHEPVPAGADVQPAGRRTSTTSRSRACSTTARTSSRRSPTTSSSSAATRSAPSTRSTGRACSRRSSTTSPATSRPREANDEHGQLRRAVGQLRQHLRRPRRAHDGPADPPPGARDQRERRARRVLPHRHLPRAQRRRDARDLEPVDGHLQGVELRALRLRPAGPRRARARGSCSRPTSSDHGVVHAERRRVRAHRATSASSPGRSTHADRARDDPRHLAALRRDDRHRTPPTASRSRASTLEPGVPMIVLETALPAKFAETIVEAIGRRADAAGGAARHRATAQALHGDAGRRRRRSSASSPSNAPERHESRRVQRLFGLGQDHARRAAHRAAASSPASGSRSSSTRTTTSTSTSEGKDSWRHRQAGAFEVVVASDRRLAKIREYEVRAEPTVHQLIAELYDCDWVLVEGFKHADLLKIEVWRAADGQAGAVSERSVRRRDRPPTAPTQLPVPDRPAGARPERRRMPMAHFLLGHPERYEYRSPLFDDPTPRPPMLTLDEALERLLGAVRPFPAATPRRSRPSTRSAACWPRTCARRSTCRRPTTARWTAMRCAAPTSPQAGTVLPVSQRIPAGRSPQPLAAGHRGAHLHRRAGPARRRRGRDAGAVRRARRRRCASTPCRAPGQWIRRRGEDVRARRRRAGARRAPDAAGARPGGLGRRGDAARRAPAARRAVLHRRRAGDARRAAQAGRDLQLQPLHAARR